jgi:hypothetical protein
MIVGSFAADIFLHSLRSSTKLACILEGVGKEKQMQCQFDVITLANLMHDCGIHSCRPCQITEV